MTKLETLKQLFDAFDVYYEEISDKEISVEVPAMYLASDKDPETTPCAMLSNDNPIFCSCMASGCVFVHISQNDVYDSLDWVAVDEFYED